MEKGSSLGLNVKAMDMSFMTVFDVIIGLLGIFLLFKGITCTKNKDVDPMIVTAEELMKCSDLQGLSAYIMPKTGIFGGLCIIFAIQSGLNDFGVVSFSRIVNSIFLGAFIIVWIVFSYHIHEAKKRFIH